MSDVKLHYTWLQIKFALNCFIQLLNFSGDIEMIVDLDDFSVGLQLAFNRLNVKI